jgi:hypothetical protein
MNQYVPQDIPFREIGPDGELVRTNKVAIIRKPPPPPHLSNLPEQYKLIPVHLRKFVFTPDKLLERDPNFKTIEHINENDIEILKKTDAELQKLIDVFPSLSIAGNRAVHLLFEATWDELRLNFEQLKLALFAQERRKELEEMNKGWVTDLTMENAQTNLDTVNEGVHIVKSEDKIDESKIISGTVAHDNYDKKELNSLNTITVEESSKMIDNKVSSPASPPNPPLDRLLKDVFGDSDADDNSKKTSKEKSKRVVKNTSEEIEWSGNFEKLKEKPNTSTKEVLSVAPTVKSVSPNTDYLKIK